MLTQSRTAFALCLFVLASLVVYSRFHGAIGGFASEIAHDWKIVNGNISSTADSTGFIVSIEKADAHDTGAPQLPDISGFTVDSVMAKAPAYKPGKVSLANMEGIPDLREFIKRDGRVQNMRLTQMTLDPQVILISEGDYDLPHLYEAVKALDPEGKGADTLLHKEEGKNTYLLRLPIMVGRGASLTISGRDADELRLSQESGSFLTNSGNLFILKAKITGWNEKAGKPCDFVEKRVFRPFINTWSGSHLYMAGSTIANVGYLRGKSYGVSFSSCRFCLEADPSLARPTGILVGNTFTQMYYGFYSFEAEDVAIIGNVYSDNIIYGIDPHDRSRRLIIAKNETYGSHKKHGIIVSREVNDSWIFDNYSHDNNGSGIMIDRTSINNIIANNVSTNNKGDGITFFESQKNKTYGNRVYKNGTSGIRVRNSWDVELVNDQVSDNGAVPVVVYTSVLEKKELHRDFKLDPYTRKASAKIAGLAVKGSDRKAAFKIEGVEGVTLSGVHVLSGGPVFADGIFSDETDISNNLGDATKDIEIAKKTAVLKVMQKIRSFLP